MKNKIKSILVLKHDLLVDNILPDFILLEYVLRFGPVTGKQISDELVNRLIYLIK